MVIVILYLIQFICSKGTKCQGIIRDEPLGAEAKIIKDIFNGYNRNARPVKNANDTMELISQFVLASIEKLVRSF